MGLSFLEIAGGSGLVLIHLGRAAALPRLA
jgi:hypothetical protein